MSSTDNFDPFTAPDIWSRGSVDRAKRLVLKAQQVPQGKLDRIRDFIHYSEADFGPPVTVWGKKAQGLFHNYADRLPCSRYNAGVKLAKEEGIDLHTAAFYERVLKHVHRADMLDLRHICIEGNKSNGNSILCFGYEYTTKPVEFKLEARGEGFACDLVDRPATAQPVIGTGPTAAKAVLSLFARMSLEEVLDFKDQVDAGLELNLTQPEPWRDIPGEEQH